MKNREFEDISIPKWKLTVSLAPGKVYRVYKNATEFEVVEATNVSEALTKCGIQAAYMVKPGAMDDISLVDRSMLMRDVVMDVPLPVENPPSLA